MYTEDNFPTKKAFMEAVAAGKQLRLFAPGIGRPNTNGIEWVAGPHAPKPHTWYAQVLMRDGIVVQVK